MGVSLRAYPCIQQDLPAASVVTLDGCIRSPKDHQVDSINMLTSLSRSIRCWVTPRAFLAALGLFCISWASILLLHNSFKQLTDESVLDLRSEGYTEADVKQLLHDAGAQGRQTYLWISLIDLGVFMHAYAFLLSALLTMASSVAPIEAFKYLNLLPGLAWLFDVAENSLIISMLLTYPDLVNSVAAIVPGVSRWKWIFLYMCACLVGGSGCYCVAVAAGLAGKRQKRKAGAAAAQTPKQQQRQGRSKRA